MSPRARIPASGSGRFSARCANAGRDKATLVVSPPISTFGYWVEQLIAESTGKEGKGILPVEGETLGDPAVYGNDRVFVYLRTETEFDAAQDDAMSAAGGGGPAGRAAAAGR